MSITNGNFNQNTNPVIKSENFSVFPARPNPITQGIYAYVEHPEELAKQIENIIKNNERQVAADIISSAIPEFVQYKNDIAVVISNQAKQKVYHTKNTTDTALNKSEQRMSRVEKCLVLLEQVKERLS
jgi:predicted KAP-like P-loop ATPase